MNWNRLRLFVPAFFLLRAVYLILNWVCGDAAVLWMTAVVGAAGLCVLAPAAQRRLIRGKWLYRLYRLRKDPALEARFYLPPRPGLLERCYQRIRPPRWCRTSQDDLLLIYRDQHKLLREGALAIAVLVQANVRLFERGSADHPANVVYTTDFEMEDPVPRLAAVAHRIGSLKGTKPEDPFERQFARLVTYELGRDFRITVPEALSGGIDATYTTIMVHRKHLPEGYVSNYYFPLLIHAESRAAMILPARYWPAAFLQSWTQPAQDA